ncbi:MAG: 23S rRNA pseudouridine(2605) synthase RluB [Francisellaceae bacterium]
MQFRKNNRATRHGDSTSGNGEKLQKILAQYGLGSRRAMEEMIAAGRIKVNNKVATLGERVSIHDRISVDGKALSNQGVRMTRPRVILYNKPDGLVCSRKDDKGRKTVFDALENLQKGRWVMIGRLDVNTTGLLLFTTDGELANRLMHPSYEIEREYAVRVFGELSDEALENLKNGVMLEDGMAKFRTIVRIGGENKNVWYHVTLSEGRNREVRRLFATQGVTVSRLTRVRYGDLVLPRDLSAGKSRELMPGQVNTLRESVGLKKYYFPKSLLNKLERKR